MPLKKALTVPRLELSGAYILSNLMNTVYKSLNVESNSENYYCCVDSQIVLSWIKATGREFKMFVENRLNFIRKKVSPENWHYRQTVKNSADVITELYYVHSINNYNLIENTLFWEGPEYLKEKSFELQLPSNMEGVGNTGVFNEEIKIVSNFVSIVPKCESIDNIKIGNFQLSKVIVNYIMVFTIHQ